MITVGSISTLGIVGLTTVIPLVAFQFAWMSASPRYVEKLQASLLPGTPTIIVGEAWKMGGAEREPAEQPLWWVRTLAIVVATLIFLSFFYQSFKI